MIYNGDYHVILPPDDTVFSGNHKIIIPIMLSLLILLGLVATVLIIRKRSKLKVSKKLCNLKIDYFSCPSTENAAPSRILATSTSETPTIANIMGKNNSEPNYPAVRVQNSNLSFSSVDSNKYKIEGNGERNHYGINI